MKEKKNAVPAGRKKAVKKVEKKAVIKPSQDTEKSPKKDKRLQNLRPPWKKGESGNPAGPPKGHVKIATQLRRLLNMDSGEKHQLTGESLTELQVALIAAIKKSKKGDIYALNSIMDRVDGKPSQPIELPEKQPTEEELNAQISNLLGKTQAGGTAEKAGGSPKDQ